MVIVDASDGTMFVKKVLHLLAISFLSVIILPSNLKNSGNCVLFVVLFVTSNDFPRKFDIICIFSQFLVVIHYFCLLYIAF